MATTPRPTSDRRGELGPDRVMPLGNRQLDRPRPRPVTDRRERRAPRRPTAPAPCLAAPSADAPTAAPRRTRPDVIAAARSGSSARCRWSLRARTIAAVAVDGGGTLPARGRVSRGRAEQVDRQARPRAECPRRSDRPRASRDGSRGRPTSGQHTVLAKPPNRVSARDGRAAAGPVEAAQGGEGGVVEAGRHAEADHDPTRRGTASRDGAEAEAAQPGGQQHGACCIRTGRPPRRAMTRPTAGDAAAATSRPARQAAHDPGQGPSLWPPRRVRPARPEDSSSTPMPEFG